MQIVAKISDFGTVRTNTEQAKGVLRTHDMTHASTKQVCGTQPYMPVEYFNRGHVSTRTDAFAFGIMVIELLTGLSPAAVRQNVDDTMYDEMPQLICQHHDDAKAKAAAANAPICAWPPTLLEALGEIAAKSAFLQHKRRVTIASVLPELEGLQATLTGLPLT
jgi:serine/threonine protein kinase